VTLLMQGAKPKYRLLQTVFAVLCILKSAAAGAWSGTGHALIAQEALLRLPQAVQRQLEQDAKALLARDASHKPGKKMVSFSAFAQAAAWPDQRRDLTLQQLFQRYSGQAVPDSLAKMAGFSTGRWHYQETALWSLQKRAFITGCANTKGQLQASFAALLKAYPKAKNAAERGLILAFVSHLLADAYQPLHTFGAQEHACQSDAGGNGFCVKPGRPHCKTSLHQFWDQALNHRPNLPAWPLSEAPSLASVFVDNHQLAKQVFSLPENTPVTDSYRKLARSLSEAQAAKAAAHLASLLRDLTTKAPPP
jgi:hypothetical protein